MITPPKIIIAAPNQIFESTTSLKIKYPANEAQRRPVYSTLARNDASAFFRAILKNRNAKPPTNPVRKNKNQSHMVGGIQSKILITAPSIVGPKKM